MLDGKERIRLLTMRTEHFEDILKILMLCLDTVGGEIYKKSFKVLKRGGLVVSMLSMPDEALMKKFHSQGRA
jgi:NADPH:quinone reductase-like Zn-dependent oxidoreductase